MAPPSRESLRFCGVPSISATRSAPNSGYDPGRERIYRNLLEKAKAQVPTAEVRRRGWRWGLFGAPVEAGLETGREVESQFVSGDLTDIDYVAKTLRRSTAIRTIVIDNFHHASDETQRAIARDFAILGSQGFKIVIAGTWRQGDYLVTHNTDLAAYYRSISIDPWSLDELAEVVLAGAVALGYAMPAATANALAAAAQGSIWALQTSTARFYLDQIAGVAQYQNANNDNVRVNLAAQRVSAEKLPELATILLRVCDWGAADNTGRSHVSYVVEAILRATPQQLQAGFREVELKRAVDHAATRWSKAAHRKPLLMSTAECAKKLKHDWMKHQITEHNTPLIVYDRDRKLITVNDSALVFVHRTMSDKLVSALMELLRERASR
jgi:hypothetical protein